MIHSLTPNMDICGACGRKIAGVPMIGFCAIPGFPHEQLTYAICRRCMPKPRKGLSPDQLARLDARIDARIAELGLASKPGRH